MDLDRGMLARIDRRLLSGIGTDERCQMVRVPISAAMWSTWKRYCAAVGVPMGRGVAGLIAHELGTVVAQDADDKSVFDPELGTRLAARAADLDARERLVIERELTLRVSEQRLKTMVRLIRAKKSPLEAVPKVGRNERCPCGSNIKHKRCHGA